MDAAAPVVVPRRTRVRVGVGAAVVLVLVGFAVAVLVTALGSHGETQSVPRPAASLSAVPSSSAAPSGRIYVHILGSVASPGLFMLRDGDRAVDAVAAAGGFTATADRASLNLARLLVDGEQIYVPAVGETPPVAVGGSAGGGGAAASGSTVGGKINLNTADETALETLPRVGPAMAKRIIDWRTTNGRFTAVEDLLSVSGIGDKTFEQLKDLVTV